MRSGNEGLTWKCHVCGAERPDEKISVHKESEWAGVPGMRFEVAANVRYCNDREACCAGAEAVGLGWLASGDHDG